MRNARPLAFLLTRALFAAPFVLRTNLELLRVSARRLSNGEGAAAAVRARRGPLLDAGRVIDGLRESGAPSYDVFCRAWRAYMAREREAGLEAAAMDVIR